MLQPGHYFLTLAGFFPIVSIFNSLIAFYFLVFSLANKRGDVEPEACPGSVNMT
jgi:hypothetical protein